MKLSFSVFGKVQGVMFRKTFVYGAKKRSLRAGATNCSEDRNRVYCSLEGEEDSINEFINSLKSLEKLNSWGAKVDSLELSDEFNELSSHQVTTENVDQKNWTSGVEFFL